MWIWVYPYCYLTCGLALVWLCVCACVCVMHTSMWVGVRGMGAGALLWLDKARLGGCRKRALFAFQMSRALQTPVKGERRSRRIQRSAPRGETSSPSPQDTALRTTAHNTPLHSCKATQHTHTHTHTHTPHVLSSVLMSLPVYTVYSARSHQN